MKEKLIELERQLDIYSNNSKLTKESLSVFPENFQHVHSYKLFGDNLLAIPANLIIEGDDEDFEKPFSFLADEETLQIFEREFRAEIPAQFIQIGNLYGSTEIVLLNKIRNTIHIFHVQDIVDIKWLNYKLKKEICTLETFIENLRPQTVCCFMNPVNHSQWDIFEIRNSLELKSETTSAIFSDNETTLKEYFKLVDNSLKKGYALHYAPKKVSMKLDK